MQRKGEGEESRGEADETVDHGAFRSEGTFFGPESVQWRPGEP